MKTLLVSALGLLASCAANAQGNAPAVTNVAAPFSSSSAGISLLAPVETSRSRANTAPPPDTWRASEVPAVTPAAPGLMAVSGDSYRWQLALGYEYARFRSSAFDLNLNGLHTDLAYFRNDWLGLEGSVVAAFGPSVAGGKSSKYLLFTGGPKITWRRARWEPFGHVLAGGLHVVPQTALGGRTGFALQAGGGADWHVLPLLSVRFEGDWVYSRLYSTGQNSFQAGISGVFHF